MDVKCHYCHKPIDDQGEAYGDPGTQKFRIFHTGQCHDEARKDSRRFGIDDFRNAYDYGERDKFK
jgi:hypothetical protein